MNLIDRFICELDTGLRTVFAKAHAERRLPKPGLAEKNCKKPLSAAERDESMRLMRVNHCGEVCAQALYQGQALVAKDAEIKKLLLAAANEEHDHLAWCDTRVTELGGRTSRFNPFFYAGSFGLGVVSGLLGDKWSLGFLVETERQVEAHLRNHLGRISIEDAESRVILETMREDEIRHGNSGLEQGAQSLPPLVKGTMRRISSVMTTTAYWA
jgi:ubiquinone biosynthesis monooxygenase Coq7